MKLTCMRGYPGSGKSTIANDLAAKTGAVVVNRDYLRKMLHDNYFSGKGEFEDEVTIAERASVRAFLKAGKSVIVDATHLQVNYLRKWSKMAAEVGASFEVVDAPTDVEHCVVRDHLRGLDGERSVGEAVIRGMAKKHPMKSWPTVAEQVPFEVVPYEFTPGLPWAIIVDIDGTLAHMDGKRSPYDYSKVSGDSVDEQVTWLVTALGSFTNERWAIGWDGEVTPADAGFPALATIICSGRDDTSSPETMQWLKVKADIVPDLFLMRPTGAKEANGNKLPDYKVKYNLFDQHIRGKYNIRFVLDDRNQVVDLWRQLGLKCLQVEPGDF